MKIYIAEYFSQDLALFILEIECFKEFPIAYFGAGVVFVITGSFLLPLFLSKDVLAISYSVFFSLLSSL